MEQLTQLAFSVSVTTRKPRSHETPGRDYHFMDAEEFQKQIEAGAFIEWEEVYPGRFYGTLINEIERIGLAGQVPIFDVDVKGGLNLKKQFGLQALALFLEPPSLEALAERLRIRGTEDETEIQMRLNKAVEELKLASKFDHIVTNDDLETAITKVEGLISNFLKA